MKETILDRRHVLRGAAATVAAAALPAAAMAEKSWTGQLLFSNKPNAIQAVRPASMKRYCYGQGLPQPFSEADFAAVDERMLAGRRAD